MIIILIINLDNKESIVKWLFNLHNQVNITLNKPIMEYDTFKEKYRNLYYNEKNKPSKYNDPRKDDFPLGWEWA